MESLSMVDAGGDETAGRSDMNSSSNNNSNYVNRIFPNVSCTTWEVTLVVFCLYPLSYISNYKIFAFTSALGVLSVVGGILVTLVYGVSVDPGWERALDGLWRADGRVRWWPESWANAFGSSFGTIAYLFCINFLTFPIMDTMREPEHYGRAVREAVLGVWVVNVVFAIVCLGFYGDNTQDLVLANLNNGSYLLALKMLLCVDLLFTFPIVFSSGRQILEHAWLSARATNIATVSSDDNKYEDCNDCHNRTEVTTSERAVLVAIAVAICFALAQIGGFGSVANLVGGVAQGTLAFVFPPAIILKLAKDRKLVLPRHLVLAQWLVGGFGVVVVTAVSFSTACGMFANG